MDAMERITVVESGSGSDIDIPAYSCCYANMSMFR